MTNFIFKQHWHYYCKSYYNRDFITICALIWFESFFPLILMGYKMDIYVRFHFYWQWFLKRTKSCPCSQTFQIRVPTGAKGNLYLDIRFCECCNCSVFIFPITKVQMLYAPYLHLLSWIPARRAWEPPSKSIPGLPVHPRVHAWAAGFCGVIQSHQPVLPYLVSCS